MHRIIIETEDYAGSFERELTAYATGQVGECSVGAEEADLAQDEMKHIAWWKKHLVPQYNQEDQMDQLCEIWPHPMYVNNGYGEHFHVDSDQARALERSHPAYMCVSIVVDEVPPPDVWEEFGQRVVEFCEQAQNPIGFTSVRHEPIDRRPKPRRR